VTAAGANTRWTFPCFCQKSWESVRFTTGAIQADEQSHFVPPRVGRIRTHEPTTTLLTQLQGVPSAWVQVVSFICEVEHVPKTPRVCRRCRGSGRWGAAATPALLEEAHQKPAAALASPAEAGLTKPGASRQRGRRHWWATCHRLGWLHVRVTHIW